MMTAASGIVRTYPSLTKFWPANPKIEIFPMLGRALRIYRRVACHAPASEAEAAVTGYSSSTHQLWTPRDRCSIAKSLAAHDRLVQKITLTAIVDQADN